MKIALIGDVHANLPALEAVLADIGKQKVDAIWNTGDFVGYGAFPEEVVRRLRQVKAVSVDDSQFSIRTQREPISISCRRLAFIPSLLVR